MSRSTSVIRRVPGNVTPTKTPTACYGNIFRTPPTCRDTAKRAWMRSHCVWIPAPN